MWSVLLVFCNCGFHSFGPMIRIRGLWKFPVGRDWLWGKLGLVLMGGAMFISVQSLSPVRLFATLWTEALQASLSITNSWSLLKLMSVKLMMTCNHLILCHPLLHLWSFPASGFFQWVSSSHQMAKVLEFQLQHQSFQWIFRTDFL